MTRRLVIIAFFFLILAAPSFSKEDGDDFIWVGVMRNDGILIPVGLYQAGKWYSPWTDKWDKSRIELEDDTRQEKHRKKLSEIPSEWLGKTSKMPSNWFLLSKDGKSVPFNVLESVKFTSHCVDMWGLRTNYKSGIKDSEIYDWPKPTVGIGVSRKVRFLPINEMGKSIPKGLDIWSLLKREFEKQEEIRIEEFLEKVPSSETDEGYLRGLNIPLSGERRAKLKIDIEKVFEVRGNIRGDKLHYIEASRKYRNPRKTEDYNCGITYFSGWLWAGKVGMSFAKAGASFADCDGKGIETTVPWVALVIDGRHYLVSVSYGWEWEYFTVLEVGNKLIWEILKINGGGC